MKHFVRTLAAAALIAVASQANAGFWDWLVGQLGKGPVDYGFWLCSNCYIPAPGTPVDMTTGPVDLQVFIKVNNAEIHDSKSEKVHRWTPNSKITVCNSGNTCITVMYPAGQNFWLPAAGSYPLPPGKTPKVPKYPDVAQSPPSGARPGRVVLVPIGLPVTTSRWNVTLPETTRRVVTPSVTIIQDGVSTTYVGSAVELGSLNTPVGDTLNWGSEAGGLDYYAPGGGGSCHLSSTLCQRHVSE
jgi:hypothetical protein